MTRVVTGIQPSGTPHLGNYFGMILPALELAREASAIYFVADYHALTTVRDPAELRALTYDVTATWLALVPDANESVLYLQSDLPEVSELSWLLGCVLAKGLLNRGPIFAETDEIAARVKRIVTDSRRPDEPKDPDTCNVFALYRLVAPAEGAAAMAARYRAGSIGYLEAKELLIDAYERRFGAARGRYRDLLADRPHLRRVLTDGADRVRAAVRERVQCARDAVGIVGV